MRPIRTIITYLITAVIASMLCVAQANPWKDEPGHGKNAKEEKRYEKRKNRAERRHAGPPPWAPAYGERRKHPGDKGRGRGRWRDDDRDEREWRDNDRRDANNNISVSISDGNNYVRITQDIGISSGNCNREVVGTLVGGVIGGIVGNKLAKKSDNEKAGTLAGALFGAIIGNQIGSRMDRLDHQCTGQALERAADGQWVKWRNEDNGTLYRISPYKTYQQNGRYCRKYHSEAHANGRINRADGAACRNKDGSWQYL